MRVSAWGEGFLNMEYDNGVPNELRGSGFLGFSESLHP